MSNPVQKVVLTFLRIISGAHNTVSRWVLLRDFGLYPCQMQWACLCARFWNRLTSPPIVVIGRETLIADVELFRQGNMACWTARFLRLMCDLGLVGEHSWRSLMLMTCDDLMALRFSEKTIEEKLKDRYENIWRPRGSDPRTSPRVQHQVTRHTVWFASNHMKHLRLIAPPHYIKVLMRFRLGSTWLQVHQDHNTVVRHQRTCRVCSCDRVEDEKHVIFECVAYARFRRAELWKPLFLHNSGDVHVFMNQEEQYRVAHFLVIILRYRSHTLVRLAERGPGLQAIDGPPNVQNYIDDFSSSSGVDD